MKTYPNPITGSADLPGDGQELHASGEFYKQFVSKFGGCLSEDDRVQRKIIAVVNHPFGSTEEKLDDLIVKVHALCAAVDHLGKHPVGDRPDWMALLEARKEFTI